MSIKITMFLEEWKEDHYIHVYRDMADDKYYLESKESRMEIPEHLAKKIAVAIGKGECREQ